MSIWAGRLHLGLQRLPGDRKDDWISRFVFFSANIVTGAIWEYRKFLKMGPYLDQTCCVTFYGIGVEFTVRHNRRKVSWEVHADVENKQEVQR